MRHVGYDYVPVVNMDTEQEKKRLQGVYSAMTDEELLALAEDSVSLTSEAVQSLTSEIAQRKLKTDSASSEESGEHSEELVTIQRFRALPEAMLAKGMLDSAGIQSVVVDDNTGRMLGSGAVGGIRLQVNRADADAAKGALTQSSPESCTCGSNRQVHWVKVHICPNCGKAEFVMPQDITQRLR